VDPRHLDEAIVEASFPSFYKHFLELAAFSERFSECETKDRHAQAVLCQCKVLWDRFQSILMLASAEYGPSAIVLYRSLVELSASIIYLAQDGNRLDEFMDAGKKAFFENMKEFGASAEKLALIEPDYRAVLNKYKSKNWNAGWHGLSKKTLFDTVGFNEGATGKHEFYNTVYSESSDIVHAGPLLTTYYRFGTWFHSIEHGQWTHLASSAMACSYIMTIESYRRTNELLRLGFDDELTKLVKECEPVAEKLLNDHEKPGETV